MRLSLLACGSCNVTEGVEVEKREACHAAIGAEGRLFSVNLRQVKIWRGWH